MMEVLWLLLPVAAASGWLAARRTARHEVGRSRGVPFPDQYIKGLNYLLTEQSDRALEVFIDMVDVDPDTVETHLILGSLFRRRGEVDRAIRIHQNLVERKNLDPPQRANALMELGRDYMKAGLLDQAESLFKELIQLGFLQAEAWRCLRTLYERERDWANAIRASEQLCAFSTDPQNQRIAQYHCELAEMARAGGEAALAGQHARKALSFDRGCARADILMGDLAMDDADPSRAVAHYSRVVRQDAGLLPLVFSRLDRAFQDAGHDEGLVSLLMQLQDQQPSSTALALALAQTLEASDRMDDLEALLQNQLAQESTALGLVPVYLRCKIRHGPLTVETLTGMMQMVERYLEGHPCHTCTQCGFQSRTHFWHCPGCRGWATIRPIDSRVEQRPETCLTPP
ncbi:Lipopolysaccharide biosynthesis regulator YciM, contains six TPR domains and a predicted metal-binding C-terminal domain [Ectothiorhodospira magna]|uniref:Lipopolysaccharide assembly protein B n=1 Tax=Ectothiorhodospira magna TaxID=867345 RepID=A0A1H9BWR3_9GAMM|nr:lipopolysaccharide assembly protein LapB [Ectothiorhodospira magna]SEP93013.1 Lipopolysaccharide biosynthesis regulator YciM, contains six TPR domains and a predicted metal-binding C-terminal domain [Ectothiorhodospira magna]